MQVEKPLLKLLTVREIFQKENLAIPYYQRPYLWNKKNVSQLIADLFLFMELGKKEYRLGNLILHNDKSKLDIVDGQQRITTLTIILYLLEFEIEKLSFLKSSFDSNLSVNKILENKTIIETKLKDYDKTKKEKLKSFILDNCQFVYIELNDLSEAFQLFDSQNARGKALEAYDLLKAFHLREMGSDTEAQKLECVKKWERYVDNKKIGAILGNNLFKIRKWCRKDTAYYLDKDSIDEFKGISIDEIKKYPYLKGALFNIQLVEDLSKNSILNSLDYKINFPFQINQTIVNGKYFFKYVDHYAELFDKLFYDKNATFYRFYQEHTSYYGSWRQGDVYVKEMFQAAIITYYDKFGEVEFDEKSKELCKWAYILRLKLSRVSYSSINKYVGENNQFREISKAYYPHEILRISPALPEIKMEIPKIQNLFNK